MSSAEIGPVLPGQLDEAGRWHGAGFTAESVRGLVGEPAGAYLTQRFNLYPRMR